MSKNSSIKNDRGRPSLSWDTTQAANQKLRGRVSKLMHSTPEVIT